MVGVALAVLVFALVIGFLGRLMMPGRHGLFTLVRSDPRLLRRFIARDVELRWELGGSVLGAVFGYVAGVTFDAWAATTTSTRWPAAILMSVVFTGISIASGVIENSRFTRKLGIHRGLGGANG